MKKPIHLLFFLLFYWSASAQITSPVTRANFGVDGELRTNYLDKFIQSSDDWFGNGTAGAGRGVIDTTGAAALVSRYLVDPAFRKLPFFRTMSVPQMTVVNNRLWIDAVYIRDYNGQSGGDSTAFVMSNKNGDSPANWTGGTTSVLDKNDIADIMVHVRRAGPSKTDSLWFFGGLSLQGTNGNRYFDFELYQTDIFYSRSTGRFTNYGPNDGHTAWQFDAAGNVTKPGDAIFTAEYSSSSLTGVEARIWVHRSALNITPAGFNWGGSFDGASNGSQYGYANINPKTTGAYYTGLQSGNGTWAGPFKFIDGNNAMQDNYTGRQFMEFSVNLSKLGLDPITLLGGDACGLPFRRILVKSRSSTSFTSELKDFIGPFDFFKTAPVEALTDVPLYCGPLGVSELKVMNPLPSSVYTWSTMDGYFVYDSVGTNVVADRPGTYIVKQQLLDGCSSASTDTVVIVHDAACVPMQNGATNFRGQLVQQQAKLQWQAELKAPANFIVQRSVDGKTFENIGTLPSGHGTSYTYTDDVQAIVQPYLYYRLITQSSTGAVKYSAILRLQKGATGNSAMVYPNPASSQVQVHIPAEKSKKVKLTVFTIGGKQVHTSTYNLNKGANTITISEVDRWQPGIYLLAINDDNNLQWLKFIVSASGTAVLPR